MNRAGLERLVAECDDHVRVRRPPTVCRNDPFCSDHPQHQLQPDLGYRAERSCIFRVSAVFPVIVLVDRKIVKKRKNCVL